ncbi:MAG: hypothetical protein JW860_09960 [Sedimentisphaerales bacterium]|nr:hypothetical protein [Sedimentisphaerales bacterium]
MDTKLEQPFDINKARATLIAREKKRAALRHARWEQAKKDCERIIAHIMKKYKPAKIYQWGSLLAPERFTEISDIDIALEGLAGPLDGLAALGEAEDMTDIPVDIVELERIHPAHAQSIRERGVLVYEREGIDKNTHSSD